MRKPFAAVVAVALAALVAAPAAAITQDAFVRIVAQTWSGASVQNADFTRNGKAYLEQSMTFRVEGGDRFSGTVRTAFTLDGVTYRRVSDVYGTLDRSRESLTIVGGRERSAERLPFGLRWCDGTGTLRFYNDSEHAGAHVLEGWLDDDCGGRSKISLSDR